MGYAPRLLSQNLVTRDYASTRDLTGSPGFRVWIPGLWRLERFQEAVGLGELGEKGYQKGVNVGRRGKTPAFPPGGDDETTECSEDQIEARERSVADEENIEAISLTDEYTDYGKVDYATNRAT
eukprot:1334644-Amorphochlora_amoeboformis.AAC.4